MIGKDIIRFHTVYWPAFLMSAGIELPRKVFVARLPAQPRREDEQVGGQRRRPDRTSSTRSGVDQVRYFFLREVPFGQDGSYSDEAIIGRINADLANELGNLAQRSLSMVAKNLGRNRPRAKRIHRRRQGVARGRRRRCSTQCPRPLRRHRNASRARGDLVGARRGQQVLLRAGAVGAASEAEDEARFRTVLYTTLETVRIATLLSQPVMPESTGKLLDLLGQARRPADVRGDRHRAGAGYRAACAGGRVPALSGAKFDRV